MALRTINTNIAGRVKKVKTKDFLVPLFEAVSNSIQAIEAAGNGDGTIVIELLRQPRQLKLDTSEREPPITGFVITDNGVGFDEKNMDSFCEADSLFKERFGGKGVGRFSWPKFFESATVESVFSSGGKHLRRGFTFSSKGVEESPPVEVKADIRTEVRLSPLHVAFEPRACRSIDQIAIELVEHFIAYLVTGSMPTTKVVDGAASEDTGGLYRRSIGIFASMLFSSSFNALISTRSSTMTAMASFFRRQAHSMRTMRSV